MVIVGIIGIAYCATRPGPRTEVGPSAVQPARSSP
jgi:hypothetical protein